MPYATLIIMTVAFVSPALPVIAGRLMNQPRIALYLHKRARLAKVAGIFEAARNGKAFDPEATLIDPPRSGWDVA